MKKFENEIEKLVFELQNHIDKGVVEFKMPYGLVNINLNKLKQELKNENNIRSNRL